MKRIGRWQAQAITRAILLLLLVLAVPFLAGFWPVVEFPHEEIRIQVHPDHVIVRGDYVYRNPYPFPVIQGFSIPLPVDAEHPTPIQLSLDQIEPAGKSVAVRYLFGQHRFELPFAARETIRVRLQYYQVHLGSIYGLFPVSGFGHGE